MTAKVNLENLLNENFYATEILRKAGNEAHNNLFKRIFQETELRCQKFSNYMIGLFSWEDQSVSLSKQAQASAEKIWMGMVGLLVHRNGPALMGESIKVLRGVKEALAEFIADHQQYQDDMHIRGFQYFLDSTIVRMRELRAAIPSD